MAEQSLSDTDLIKEKINIVDFINAYVPLKKAGRNFKGSCPFHAEKDPSFFVSPERSFYYCFGCQKSGDIFTFLMEKEGLTFPEALKVLADRAGVQLSSHPGSKQSHQGRERLAALSLSAAEFYHQLLLKHPVGGRARKYLKKRKIDADSIKKFMLGYAPNSWESTGQFLLSKKYTEKELLAVGLIIKKQKARGRGRNWYDRFRGRVMFPIFDTLGRVVGFSGRTLKDDPKIPKYINSPDSPIFHKGKLLYGLNLAKEALHAQGEALLVEGNLDVISCFQAGIKNVVAPLGTGFTIEQALLIKRFASRLRLLFDRDQAGEQATLEGIKIGLSQGLAVSVVQLSQGKDPDEAITQDLQRFRADLAHPQSFFGYLVQKTQQRFNLGEIGGKSSAAAFILPFLALLADQISKDGYVKKLAIILGVEEKSVWQNLDKLEQKLVRQNLAKKTPSDGTAKIKLVATAKKNRQELLGDYLITLILGLPKALWLQKELEEVLFNQIQAKFLLQEQQKEVLTALTESFLSTQEIRPEQAAKRLKSPLSQKKLDRLLLESSRYNLKEELFLPQLKKVAAELEGLYYKKKLQGLSQALQEAQSQGQGKKTKRLREQIQRLNSLVTQRQLAQ